MNMKKIIWIVGMVAVISIGVFLVGRSTKAPVTTSTPQEKTGSDPKNATYQIENNAITLVNGISEIAGTPDSAAKITTRYFGNEVRHDLNGDGREDVAFLMTQNTEGSGTFYYVVASLNTPDGYIGSRGLLLGDRIAPQTTEMSRKTGQTNVIVVNYAERKPGEPFTARPSVGKSMWLLFDPKIMQFGEVVQDFEGEADPNRMTLTMKTWDWIKVLYNDGREIVPRQSKKFTLTFSNNGKFSATTDCNSMSGDYTATKDSILFGAVAATQMYCEGSQEADFTALFQSAQKYHFTSKGELIIDLKFDSGSAVFR